MFNGYLQRSQPHQRFWVPSQKFVGKDEEGNQKPITDEYSCAMSINYGNAGFSGNGTLLGANYFGAHAIAQDDVPLTNAVYDIDHLQMTEEERRWTYKTIQNNQLPNHQRKETNPVSANIVCLRPMIMWNRSGQLEDLSFTAWIYNSVVEIEIQNGRFDVFNHINNWNGSNTDGIQGVGNNLAGQA